MILKKEIRKVTKVVRIVNKGKISMTLKDLIVGYHLLLNRIPNQCKLYQKQFNLY